MSWNLPTSPAAQALISGYQSGFGPAGGDLASIAYSDVAGSSSSTTSHVFTGLAGNVAYDFYIRAVNLADGRAGVAATVSATALATIIGLESTTLTVAEGRDTSARVCVSIPDPMTLVRAPFSLSLRTMDATATAGDDYDATAVALGPFTATDRRDCANVGIIDDETVELAETFQVFLATSGSFAEVIVSPSSLTVTITSDDFNYDPDGNGLINVATTSQLSAIRYDLNGHGPAGVSAEGRADYLAAFTLIDAAETCPSTCTGYELLNDLDLSSAGDWTPIGKGTDQGGDDAPANTRYQAIFDGNGYVIRNMRIVVGGADNYNHAGLFSALGPRGQIRGVGLVDADVDISARNSVNAGALAGVSHGRIAASYAVGGTVTGTWVAGGLTGRMFEGAVLIASYTSMSVVTVENVSGGLVGAMHDGGVVSASYAIGRVSRASGRPERAGGLVGERRSANAGEIQSSYFDSERSGRSSCCGHNPVSSDGDTPRRSADLRAPTTAAGTLYAGWDRLNVNNVDENNDGDFNDDAPWDFGTIIDYPVLRGADAAVARRQFLSQPPAMLMPTLTGAATVFEGTTAEYTVIAPVPLPEAATAHWSVVATAGAGMAAAGDFADDAGTQRTRFPSGTATIAAGDSTATFSVYTFDDQDTEPAERFSVRVDYVENASGRIIWSTGNSSVVVTTIGFSDGVDYDVDDNLLIDVATTSQLSAIRYDLDGRGLAGVSGETDMAAYLAAFPVFDPSQTCPTTCTGYELLNDLDLSSVTTWTPIGGGSTGPLTPAGRIPISYKATLEGNGRVISNLRVSTLRWYTGLFSVLGAGGVIRNVGLVNVDVYSGNAAIGALVGINDGTVAASYVVSGSVVGNAGSVGGLVGTNNGTVVASYANVKVGTGMASGGGGLVHWNAGRIVASYSYGDGEGCDRTCGGLASIQPSGHQGIERSYFDGSRGGWDDGLRVPSSARRDSDALRRQTAARGIYDGWDRLNVDGLNDNAPWDFGTFIDYPVLRGADASVARRQFLLQEQLMFAVTLTGPVSLVEGETAEYTVRAPIVLPYAAMVHWSVVAATGTGIAAGADFGDGAGAPLARFPTGTAVIAAGSSATTFSVYPFDDEEPEFAERFSVRLDHVEDAGGGRIVWSTGNSSVIVATIESSDEIDYDGDGDLLIDVATADQLSAIRYDLGGRGLAGATSRAAYLAAFPVFDAAQTCPSTCTGYELSSDIDLSGVQGLRPIGWMDVGVHASPPADIRYEGTFDGNGYVIRNMTMRDPSGDDDVFIGLFSALGSEGIIRNVGLMDVNVLVGGDERFVGSLAGYNLGKIAASYAVGSGTVRGGMEVGGLVGENRGEIIACYVGMTVRPFNRPGGGLAGRMGSGGTIMASYTSGRVNPSQRFPFNNTFGGLVGDIAGGQITNSYSSRELSNLRDWVNPEPPGSLKKAWELRTPTSATGIFAEWDNLNVDDTTGTVMGVMTRNDDAPWDFGNAFQYPVLRYERDAALVQTQHSIQTLLLTPTLRGDAVVSEGGMARYVVSLERVLAPSGLPSGATASWIWSAGGAAVGADDFDGPSSGSVVIAPGQSSASFSLAVAADDGGESAEVFEVSLRDALFEGPANVRLGVPRNAVATTIPANMRRVTMASSAATVAEGATATFTLRLSGGGGAVIVEYEIGAVGGLTPADLERVVAADRNGTSSARVVALPLTGTVTIGADDAATVSVRTADESVAEADSEGFRLRLTGCSNCGAEMLQLGVPSSLTVTITNDDFMDYSSDGRLIDVATVAQLNAIRWDLDGDGVPAEASSVAYGAAFPGRTPDMGCATTCTGYALVNDLDLSGADWQPIGGGIADIFYSDELFARSEPPERIRYNATFEGNGHIIRGLRVNGEGRQWNFVGMFSMLGPRGIIRNVGLVDVDVRAGLRGGSRSVWMGALAGLNHGKIAASYVVGGTVHGSWYAGGLVGGNWARGRIIASYVNVTVQGDNDGRRIGGLAFNNAQQGRIIASYSLSENASLDAGGLVGFNDRAAAGEAAVATSYYDSNRGDWRLGNSVPASVAQTSLALRGPTTAAGIYAAWAGLNVDDTTGTVMGVMTRDDDNPWDFGSNSEYPVLRGVSARYPAGNTTNIRVQRQLQPRSVLASLAQRGGAIAEGSSVTYAVELTGVVDAATMTWSVELTGVGTGHAEASDFVGATGGQVVLAGTASAVFRVGIADDGTTEQREAFRVRLSDVQSPDDLDLRLSAASSAVVSFISPRGGMNYDTDGDRLIEMRTTTQLSAIRYDLSGRGRVGVGTSDLAAYDEAFPSFDEAGSCAGACRGYELMNDLDLSGVDWTSIGGEDTQGRDIPLADARYEGIFEGNGYIISNLTINRQSRNNFVGLFGALGARGVIRSVGLVNANVVSLRPRTLNDVQPGNDGTGGLAGISYGTIAASYAVGGTVHGDRSVGGLAGTIDSGGIVIASYANVLVRGNDRVGGVVGVMGRDSLMSASYNIGRVEVVLLRQSTTFGLRFFGGDRVGGLVGDNHENALVGDNRENAAIQPSYYERARSGQSLCCGNRLVMREAGTFKTSDELRNPTTTVGTIYAGWDRLNVNGVDENNDGDFNDDAPWDFGDSFQYPVLRYGRTTTAVQAQYSSQPEAILTPTLAGDALVSEGITVSYVVRLGRVLPAGVTATWGWSVSGGAVGADDFDGTTGGRVVIAGGESSASFSLAVAADDGAELAEAFEVSLRDALFEGADNVRLGAGEALETTIAGNGLGQVTLASSATVAEGATATFTLRLSGGVSAVVVEYEIGAAGGRLTPADFAGVVAMDRTGTSGVRVASLPVTGSVTVSTDNSAMLSVRVANDAFYESAERFRVRLTGCPNCDATLSEIGVPSSVEVGILNRAFTVAANVYLQGAYDATTMTMRTNLAGALPRTQPYGVAPWNYPATTTVPFVDSPYGLGGVTRTIVDWVLVELRASTPGAGVAAAAGARPTTGARVAGLLLADGRIAGINEDATTPAEVLSLEGVHFERPQLPEGEDVYVLIHHRNHLSVMAMQPVAAPPVGCEAHHCVNFRRAQSYGGCAQLRAGKDWMMAAGDVNRSGVVSWGDDDLLLNYSGAATYLPQGANYPADGDLNFSGDVSSADAQAITDNNLLSSECTPR